MLKTRLELYQRVTPLAGLGIFERNFLTGEIYWNSIIRAIYEVDEAYNPSLEESLKFYEDPDTVMKLVNQAFKSKAPETGAFKIITAKGNLKWVRMRLQAECNGDKCDLLYGTFEDITEHEEMMALLQEREKRLTAAFDHAPIGMAMVSLTGGWIKVNVNLCRMLGYTEAEFLKHTFQEFTHPEDLNKDLLLLKQLLDGSINTYSIEKRYYHAAGHVIWVLLNVSLIRNEDSKPLYFVSQIKDITERVKNTETIKNQNSRLLNFAHIVSHNLRSHTGNMKMLTDMIQQENDPEEKNNLIKMLNENSGNLLETLDHLNEVVKVHAGTQVERTALNLQEAVFRVVDILSASIRQANAEILVEISEELNVDFHPAYLESVIMNLISNSIKYAHQDRRVKIVLSAEQQEHQIVFKAQDNGQGIDLKLHGHKLFGMYKTFHRHPDARGMGLFLVKNQVEAMGASISAESEPGSGTTFIIHFK